MMSGLQALKGSLLSMGSGAVLVLSLIGSAHAIESVYAFDVPGGDLGTVVSKIARTAGTTISFRAALTAGRKAGPIVGTTTLQGALAKALAGTSLRVVPGPGGGLALKAAEVGPVSAAGGGENDLEAIDVTDATSAYRDNGFQAGDAGATIRLADAPIKEIPLTVSVVTNDVIKSQASTSAEDTLANVPGVVVTPGAGAQSAFTIRGFSQPEGYTVNGNRSGSGSGYALTNSSVPIDDIERVEVLKGPTSILTGVSQNGGAINITTKRPTEQVIREGIVRYGSNGYKTIAFDLGGPVPDTEGLTYRLVTSFNHADKSVGGYKDPHEYLVSPSLQWTNGDTTILGGYRFTDQKIGYDDLTFIPYGASALHPYVRRRRGNPLFNPNLATQSVSKAYYSDFSHHFGEFLGVDLTFNNHFQFEERAARLQGAAPSLNQVGSLYDYSQSFYKIATQNLSERLDLTLKYSNDFMAVTNKLGYDYLQNSVKSGGKRDYGYNSYSGVDSPYLLDPNSVGSFFPLYYLNNAAVTAISEYNSSTTSGYYYLSKIDTLDNRLHILGSVRNDDFQNSYRYRKVDDPTVNKQSRISWVAGAAFDLFPWMTVYGNVSSGFVNGFGKQADGTPVPPEGRDLSEVGARFYFLDKQLTVTTSLYDLMASNVTVVDYVADPTGQSLRVVGGQRSKGFELEVQGQITPNWAVIAGFSQVVSKYADPQSVRSVDSYTSLTFAGVPQYTANLWTTYTIPTGYFAGVTFGAGARGVSDSQSLGYTDTFEWANYRIPGYVTADAMISYAHDNWSLMLKMNNLLDKYYYLPNYNSQRIVIGQGRNFMLTARYNF